MTSQVIVKIDTSEDTLKISFDSMTKEGVTSGEKMLVAKTVDAIAKSPLMPKIKKVITNKE